MKAMLSRKKRSVSLSVRFPSIPVSFPSASRPVYFRSMVSTLSRPISVAESQQGRLNALMRGSVAATVLAPPFNGIAKQAGFRELADLRKIDIEYAGNSIAGMTPYIKSHPLLVENFLKGYIEALHYFRTQKEKALPAIMKFLKMTDRDRAE